MTKKLAGTLCAGKNKNAHQQQEEKPETLLNESSLIITATLYLGKNPMWDITETYNH